MAAISEGFLGRGHFEDFFVVFCCYDFGYDYALFSVVITLRF